jgi:hypothetical protein
MANIVAYLASNKGFPLDAMSRLDLPRELTAVVETTGPVGLFALVRAMQTWRCHNADGIGGLPQGWEAAPLHFVMVEETPERYKMSPIDREASSPLGFTIHSVYEYLLSQKLLKMTSIPVAKLLFQWVTALMILLFLQLVSSRRYFNLANEFQS